MQIIRLSTRTGNSVSNVGSNVGYKVGSKVGSNVGSRVGLSVLKEDCRMVRQYQSGIGMLVWVIDSRTQRRAQCRK